MSSCLTDTEGDVHKMLSASGTETLTSESACREWSENAKQWISTHGSQNSRHER